MLIKLIHSEHLVFGRDWFWTFLIFCPECHIVSQCDTCHVCHTGDICHTCHKYHCHLPLDIKCVRRLFNNQFEVNFKKVIPSKLSAEGKNIILHK
jgi:hypothetical protein